MSEPLVGCLFPFFECHAAIEIENQHALTSIGDRLRPLLLLLCGCLCCVFASRPRAALAHAALTMSPLRTTSRSWRLSSAATLSGSQSVFSGSLTCPPALSASTAALYRGCRRSSNAFYAALNFRPLHARCVDMVARPTPIALAAAATGFDLSLCSARSGAESHPRIIFFIVWDAHFNALIECFHARVAELILSSRRPSAPRVSASPAVRRCSLYQRRASVS